MVLFEMFFAEPEVVVAHFDHGIRENSSLDAEFVQKICSERGVKCVIGRGRLGCNASEAEARKKRYEFLREVAKENDGEIYTAHHLDDLIESVAINMIRGTGWRGLSPMGDEEIRRPLIRMSKQEIWRYAGEHKLRFRQDQTNNELLYLRNRVREKLSELPEGKYDRLVELVEKQRGLKREIDEITSRLLPEKGVYLREWFFKMPDAVAVEILRAATFKNGVRMTRVQLLELLNAVREYAPGKCFNMPGGKLLKMHKKYFVL